MNKFILWSFICLSLLPALSFADQKEEENAGTAELKEAMERMIFLNNIDIAKQVLNKEIGELGEIIDAPVMYAVPTENLKKKEFQLADTIMLPHILVTESNEIIQVALIDLRHRKVLGIMIMTIVEVDQET